jgi:murein DD-endopeptidase MepM/ murein hydrolase activator NlpD
MDAQNTISMLNRLHQVNKGETLFSIAKQYNITEQELLLANPDIKKKGKLKKGTYLAIPQNSITESQAVPEIEQKEPITNIKIGVILPFEEKTERAKKMIEFYQGFLMAADSVKKEGMSLEIYTYNSGTTEAELMNVLMNPEMATLNVLFGPVDELQLPATINFCKQNNIKLVLPFTNGQSLIENPHVYMASPNYTIGTAEAATLISRAYANKNYIILKTNNDNSKGRLFTQTLTDMLGKQGNSVRVLNIDGDDFSYEAAMNQFKDNVIVPDNPGIKSLNILISKLDTFKQNHPNYNISLLGYPEWQTFTNTLLNSFFTFDTYIYSSYYYNALAPNTKVFEQTFTRNFNKAMAINYPRYAMMGFDLAYFFMHDIWDNESFIANQHVPYQSTYRFVQEADNAGYYNRFIQLIHFTKTKQIELIR